MPSKNRPSSQKSLPIQGKTSSPLSPNALGLIADFFKLLSEVSRLQIVCSLKKGAKSVNEIITETELGQANVSKHLKMLTQAGLLTREQRGVSVYYEIANPMLFEVCDRVCDALSFQVQQQSDHLEELASLQQVLR
jgi:DNA-binding transcriptional ArsR family regulator